MPALHPSPKKKVKAIPIPNIITIFAQDTDKKIGAKIMAFIDLCTMLVAVFQLVYYRFG